MDDQILIVGPSWVGDTMMAQSLFKLIKERNPTLALDVLAPAWTFPLLSRMQEVRSPIEMPLSHGEFRFGIRKAIAKTLTSARYSQAIILPNSFKSALIPWLAKIPIRTGWLGEARFVLLNDIRYLSGKSKKSYPRLVERYLALGLAREDSLPITYSYPELRVDLKTQAMSLAKHGLRIGQQPILALCPGAAFGPAKCWPAKSYAAVAKQKILEGWSVWIFGSLQDRDITHMICTETQQKHKQNQCHNLAGNLSLTETIDLLACAQAVIANDSGLLHVAAALKRPLVAIYGPTSPDYTPPLAEQTIVLRLNLPCQPCFARQCPLQHHRCMQDLTPELVLQAIAGWGK